MPNLIVEVTFSPLDSKVGSIVWCGPGLIDDD